MMSPKHYGMLLASFVCAAPLLACRGAYDGHSVAGAERVSPRAAALFAAVVAEQGSTSYQTSLDTLLASDIGNLFEDISLSLSDDPFLRNGKTYANVRTRFRAEPVQERIDRFSKAYTSLEAYFAAEAERDFAISAVKIQHLLDMTDNFLATDSLTGQMPELTRLQSIELLQTALRLPRSAGGLALLNPEEEVVLEEEAGGLYLEAGASLYANAPAPPADGERTASAAAGAAGAGTPPGTMTAPGVSKPQTEKPQTQSSPRKALPR